MKQIQKVAKWIVKFVYKISGIQWLVLTVSCQVMAYKLRLRMVPATYKMFLIVIGMSIGASGMYVALVAPEVMMSASRVYENTNPLIIEPAHAKEVEVKEVKRDLVDFIFQKESSRGKNNYSKCEAIGKFNRYGFGIPGNGDYLCFEKGQDTVAVAGWVAQKKAAGMSDEALLCLYNTGKATETCGYVK